MTLAQSGRGRETFVSSSKDEIPVLEDAIIRSSKAVEEIISRGVDSAMNKYNR